MAQLKGYKTQMLLDWEDVYATDPSSAAALKIPFNTEDMVEAQPNQHAATIRNNRNPAKPFKGNKDVTGTVVVPVDLKAIGLWLKGLFGSPTTTGSVSPYTHVYKIGDTIPSFLLDIGHTDGTLYYKYNGCKVNTFAMTVGGDGELISNVGIIGAKETKGTSAYDPSPTDYGSAADRFENFEASAEEGGSAITYLTEFSFNIDNRCTPAYCIGDAGVKSALTENEPMITGTITGLFQDDTLLAKGRADTESSLSIILTDGVYSLTFYFPEITYNHNKPPVNGPEGILLSLDFEAYYNDDASASAVVATLVNNIASYA
jgi:hypothetical protein